MADRKGKAVSAVKTLTKREQEELKKKEQEKAAEVFEEFLASFESSNKSAVKTFVRGGIVNATKEEEAAEVSKNKLYRPATKLNTTASQQQGAPPQSAADAKRPIFKKKTEEKKKSNLELFKEELKQIQEQREERHKRKGDPGGGAGAGGFADLEPLSRRSVLFDDPFDPVVPNTTNLYIGGISPKMNEELLCKEFVKYGPLASVKIMWPRSEEERARNSNRGFVAFMTRKDAERAMATLNGKVVMGMEMKLGWGKAVRIPPQPLYRAMVLKKAAPPPPSGLPFNAQPKDRFRNDFTRPPERGRDELDKTLSEAIVRVVIPTERSLLGLIHRMIEFVVREGPMFEAIIMNKEKNNPDFRFLFDNKSQDHVYYRWKLYSILQGESPSEWRSSDFRMFRGGSLWRPPPLNPYLHDNQEEEEEPEEEENNGEQEEEEEEVKKGQLKTENRQRLESLLKELTPLREEISSAMVFCLNRAEAAEEVVSHIAESFGLIQTPLQKKIARLYLISDILHNSCAKVRNASYYRKYFEMKLPQIFRDMNLAYKNIQARLQAEQFKQKVQACFRAWEDWAVYPESFLISLQNIFLGLVKADEVMEKAEEESPDLDGAPLDGLPLDGAPLDGLPLDGLPLDGLPVADDLDGAPLGWDPLDGVPVDDIDGVPLGAAAATDDLDGMPLDDGSSVLSTVALSKWEQMGDGEPFSQARTESKWDSVVERDSEEDINESSTNHGTEGGDSDNDSSDEDPGGGAGKYDSADFHSSLKSFQTNQLKRKRLRELEVKVMKLQDELESGKRPRKCGRTVQQQVEHYRNKLLQKEFDKDQEEKRGRSTSRSKERCKEDKRGGDKRRSEEDKDRRRGRSREDSPVRTTKSPKRSKRSKSPSPDRKSSLRSRSRSPHRSHKSKKSKR